MLEKVLFRGTRRGFLAGRGWSVPTSVGRAARGGCLDSQRPGVAGRSVPFGGKRRRRMLGPPGATVRLARMPRTPGAGGRSAHGCPGIGPRRAVGALPAGPRHPGAEPGCQRVCGPCGARPDDAGCQRSRVPCGAGSGGSRDRMCNSGRSVDPGMGQNREISCLRLPQTLHATPSLPRVLLGRLRRF